MLHNDPTDSVVINEYRKQPALGPCPLTVAMVKALEEEDKLKKVGKRKTKVGPFEPAQTPK